MRTHGAKLREKNYLSLVEVLGMDVAGLTVVIGYVILHSDGEEVEFSRFYDDALAMFERLSHDSEPSCGYGM